jgi:hypothetical protein
LPNPSSPIAVQSTACSSTSASISDPAALGRVVKRLGDLGRHHLALYLFHHIERRADHIGVVAHGEHPRCGHRRRLERRQQPRLAQHVVRARRQRPARRSAKHDAGGQQEGDVGVPLADRGCAQLRRRLETAAGQELAQRLDHQQRLAGVRATVGRSGDDVVGSQCDGHGIRQRTGI